MTLALVEGEHVGRLVEHLGETKEKVIVVGQKERQEGVDEGEACGGYEGGGKGEEEVKPEVLGVVGV